MNFKNELLSIQSKYKSIRWALELKKNKLLLNQLIAYFGHKPASELFYLGLHENVNIKCHNGNNKKFKGITQGYISFCSRNCKCAREKISKLSKERWQTADNFAIQEKKKKTNLERYGVTNVLNNTIIKEQYQKSNIEKYGFDNPLKNKDIQRKVKETLIRRYGVEHPLQNKTIQQKLKNTNVNRYGVEYPRMQNNKVKEKAEKTNLERYGHINPFGNVEIQNKISKTNLERYGFNNYNQNPENIKIKKQKCLQEHNRYNHTQFHFSENTFNILNDRTKLLLLVENNTPREVAKILNIDIKTLWRYLDHLNIDLPYFHSRSLYEKEIYDFLKLNNINFKTNDRSILAGKEIDFLLVDHNFGIEFNGLYWHSEINYGCKYYHYNKTKQSMNKNIFLFHLFEDIWCEKTDLVKSFILNKVGLTSTKINARSCIVKELSKKEKELFLNENHFLGYTNNISKSYGLFNNNSLVSVMSFSKKNDNYELSRFCSKKFTIVRGAFSKLLKHFISNNNFNLLYTFADLMYSNGDVYIKNGFVIDKILSPDYVYTDFKYRYHKFLFRKNNIKSKFNVDILNKTEKELMEELKFSRIWDSGKIKFIYKGIGNY